MLVMTGGLERTEDEFRKLFEASGFRLVRVVHTDSPLSVFWKPARLDPGRQSVLTRKVVTLSDVVCSCTASAPWPTMTAAKTDSREWNSRDVSHASRSPE